MTAMNQILAKLLYLWLTFFQFHFCYASEIEKALVSPVKPKFSY